MYIVVASSLWQGLVANGGGPQNVLRYYNFLSSQEKFKAVASLLPVVEPKKAPESSVRIMCSLFDDCVSQNKISGDIDVYTASRHNCCGTATYTGQLWVKHT